MSEIADRLAAIHARIARAASAVGRRAEDVQLICVSKRFSRDAVRAAYAAGQTHFGENRLQEAEAKLAGLADLDAHWHFIGQLQRNKARRCVALFDVIHSVDRVRLVDALGRAAAELGIVRDVLVQVDIDGEPQKGGAPPEDAAALLAAIDSSPGLRPLGLMAIPRVCADAEEVRPSFARLRELRDALDRDRPPSERLWALSMGMSADFEIAIQEGATHVRVGTGVFGPRNGG